jgi:hypothetical protein
MVIEVLITIIICLLLWWILNTAANYDIVDTIRDGKDGQVYRKTLPKSVNRADGIEFSYSGWLRIDDFAFKFGVPKVIFVKGSADLTTACPALVIDANTNTLLLKVDTFGVQETISIVSVPAKKWLHFVINVNQEAVDVYINGILYAHHILSQLPKQNSASVLTSPDGGFAGKVVRIQYHPQTLTESDILSKAREQPPTGDEKDQVFPPYFDMSWFNPS